MPRLVYYLCVHWQVVADLYTSISSDCSVRQLKSRIGCTEPVSHPRTALIDFCSNSEHNAKVGFME